ncbi:hypothetical protein D018_3712B, partial [Vibrio parahaemolyticus VP2007-007]
DKHPHNVRNLLRHESCVHIDRYLNGRISVYRTSPSRLEFLPTLQPVSDSHDQLGSSPVLVLLPTCSCLGKDRVRYRNNRY